MSERGHRTLRVPFRDWQLHGIQAGSGPHMLLLHNAGNDHRIWDRQIEFFAGDYCVTAVDSLGYGRSDRPPDVDYTLPLYTEMVAAVVRELGLAPVVLIGNCIGAAMALSYTLGHPDRVKTLFLLNIATEKTIGGGTIEAQYHLLAGRPRLTRALSPVVEFAMRSRTLTRRLLRGQFGDSPPKDPEFAEHIHWLYNQPGNLSAYYNLMCNWKTLRCLDEAVRPDDFPPTYVFWGEKNRILPSGQGRDFCTRFHPNESVFVPGASHLVMREVPDVVNQALTERLNSPTPAAKTQTLPPIRPCE